MPTQLLCKSIRSLLLASRTCLHLKGAAPVACTTVCRYSSSRNIAPVQGLLPAAIGGWVVAGICLVCAVVFVIWVSSTDNAIHQLMQQLSFVSSPQPGLSLLSSHTRNTTHCLRRRSLSSMHGISVKAAVCRDQSSAAHSHGGHSVFVLFSQLCALCACSCCGKTRRRVEATTFKDEPYSAQSPSRYAHSFLPHPMHDPSFCRGSVYASVPQGVVATADIQALPLACCRLKRFSVRHSTCGIVLCALRVLLLLATLALGAWGLYEGLHATKDLSTDVFAIVDMARIKARPHAATVPYRPRYALRAGPLVQPHRIHHIKSVNSVRRQTQAACKIFRSVYVSTLVPCALRD